MYDNSIGCTCPRIDEEWPERKHHNMKKNIAVVVGYHTFDVMAFQNMFESFDGVHCYIQHLEQFTSSPEGVRDSYDAVVFYTMEHRTPDHERPWYEGDVCEAMEHLGESGQGIVVLHHSLLAFENWPVWKELCGLDPLLYHDYRLDVPQSYRIVSSDHPITYGLSDFSMTDEIYICDPICPASDMEILVESKDHQNMNAIAWTKTYQNAKVFCFQAGHGPSAYNNEQFRTILNRGILWTIK